MIHVYSRLFTYVVSTSGILDGCFLVRKKPFEVRYQHMASWSKRIIKAFGCRIQIDVTEEMPKEGEILFVSNHQSAFDMLIQLAIITTPFTFISKKENEKYLVWPIGQKP